MVSPISPRCTASGFKSTRVCCDFAKGRPPGIVPSGTLVSIRCPTDRIADLRRSSKMGTWRVCIKWALLLQYRQARILRRTGAATGSHRHLRCALLHGYGAPARDRHSGRPRCNSLPRAHTDHEARASSHGVGCHHWPCRRACRKSADCVPAVWCAADRYRDDRLCDRDDYGRGGGRQLAAGVARIAARPERRAQR